MVYAAVAEIQLQKYRNTDRHEKNEKPKPTQGKSSEQAYRGDKRQKHEKRQNRVKGKENIQIVAKETIKSTKKTNKTKKNKRGNMCACTHCHVFSRTMSRHEASLLTPSFLGRTHTSKHLYSSALLLLYISLHEHAI